MKILLDPFFSAKRNWSDTSAHLVLPWLLLACLVAGGCGLGSVAVTAAAEDDAGSGPPTPLLVIARSPSLGEAGVDPRAPIVVTFNQALDASSVGLEAIALISIDGAPVEGRLSVESTSLHFFPELALDFLVSYRVSISSALRAANRQALVGENEYMFTTRDGRWGLVDVVPVDARSIALDFQSNATVIGSASLGFIGGSRNALGGWEIDSFFDNQDIPTQFEQQNTSIVSLGSDAVTFLYGIGGGSLVGGQYSSLTNVWVRQLGIDPGGEAAQNPRVAAAVQSKDALVLGVYEAGMGRVMGTSFDINSGWAPATTLSSGPADKPETASISSALGIAVWRQAASQSGTKNQLQSAVYRQDSEWMPAILVRQFSSEIDQIAISGSSGDAVMAVASGAIIYGFVLAGEVWGPPTILVDGASCQSLVASRTMDVSMGVDGRAMLVAGVPEAILSRLFVPEVGWLEPELLPAELLPIDPCVRNGPLVSLDKDGRALAAWSYNGTTFFFDVFACRYLPSVGWGEVIRLTTVVGSSPILALESNEQGKAIVLWSDRTNNAFSRRFE